jgi:hypothetical protein
LTIKFAQIANSASTPDSLTPSSSPALQAIFGWPKTL